MTPPKYKRPDTGWKHYDEPPDPLPEVAGDALRAARIDLWRDLYAKAEAWDAMHAELVDFSVQLEALAKVMPNTQTKHGLLRRIRHQRRRLLRHRGLPLEKNGEHERDEHGEHHDDDNDRAVHRAGAQSGSPV